MPFWITAIGLTLIIGTFLLLALFRGRTGAVSPAAFDLQVYRDQLAEVDRDLSRGVLSEADADRVRTEVSRRILAADAQVQAEKSGTVRRDPWPIVTAAILVALMLAGSVALYLSIGNPGYPDLALQDRMDSARQSLEDRPSQEEFEAQLAAVEATDVDPEFLNLVHELRAAVAQRPDDLRGQELLTTNEARLGNFKAAYQAKERVISLKQDAATGNDYAQLADLMIRAAHGYVSPEADDVLRESLSRDPNNGFARYFTGLMLSQNGRPDATFRIWRDLLEAGPEAAPWIAPIRARIDDLAWFAGVDYAAPAPRPALSGPTAADIESAQDMDAEDRTAMISAMVEGLADRLANEGGTPQEWAQLISAYGVLGEIEKARVVWTEAQSVFAATPDALAPIAEAARTAGLTE